MNKVLLIRSYNDGHQIEVELKKKNIECRLYPLFQPIYLQTPILIKPKGIIITSRHALYALRDRNDLKTVPLYTVGEKTTAKALELGFTQVVFTASTSEHLVNYIKDTLLPTTSLFYLSGEEVGGEIVDSLSSAGFKIKRYIVYTIQDEDHFPPELITDVEKNNLSHVMLFSPRTTLVFINLLRRHGLENKVPNMIALCLSNNVAEKTNGISWKKVWISPTPTAESMIRYFDEER